MAGLRERAAKRMSRPTPVFLRAFFLGGEPEPFITNPNKPGDMGTFCVPDQTLVIEEGRRQLDAQGQRLEHIQSRAQTLVTVSLVVLAFSGGVYVRVSEMEGWQKVLAFLPWYAGMLLVAAGVLLGSAVVCVRATFDGVDTTQISTFEAPLHAALAADFAKAVKRGEITVADRLTAFQVATRHVVWGAMLTFIAYLVTAAA